MFDKELQFLDSIISKTKPLKDQGHLRIRTNGKNTVYYQVTKKGDTVGIYLSKKEINKIKFLAQNDYNAKINSIALKQKSLIEQFRKKYNPNEIIEIYEIMNDHRKVLINPVIQNSEKYAEEWEKLKYTQNSYEHDNRETRTLKGDLVRSKSEMLIADTLYRLGIPYRYEFPMKFRIRDYKYPDFLVLNKRTKKEYYWEHFGMIDNEEYRNKMLRKITLYESTGFFDGVNMIFTFETKTIPLTSSVIDLKIKQFLL